MALSAFEMNDGHIVVETVIKLKPILAAKISEFKATPFILLDIAEFLEDRQLQSEARRACNVALAEAKAEAIKSPSAPPAEEFFLKCLKLGQSIEEAFSETLALFGPDAAKAARASVAKRTGNIYVLRDPPIIVEHGMAEWYPGPSEDDVFWPPLKRYLINKGWLEAIEDLDKSSTMVVSRLAPPGLADIRTRGLVVGYVQSGKTANFTAVISKAADVNYRMFVVLSGLTNSLRNQTQARLEAELRDLNPAKWLTLTQGDQDFNGKMPVNVDYALSPGP
ncbi:MAG TPA: hypothetical protein VGY98_10235, partial [Verrucomicrobiae bacterium]|nr:hypothetical protein [Verrucomicrobiae bacterium]